MANSYVNSIEYYLLISLNKMVTRLPTGKQLLPVVNILQMFLLKGFIDFTRRISHSTEVKGRETYGGVSTGERGIWSTWRNSRLYHISI